MLTPPEGKNSLTIDRPYTNLEPYPPQASVNDQCLHGPFLQTDIPITALLLAYLVPTSLSPTPFPLSNPYSRWLPTCHMRSPIIGHMQYPVSKKAEVRNQSISSHLPKVPKSPRNQSLRKQSPMILISKTLTFSMTS
jgi:hypothetical protein